MNCPKCGEKLKVIDIVHNTEIAEIYRKKKCLHCNHEMYTAELEVAYDKRLSYLWNKFARYNKKEKKE